MTSRTYFLSFGFVGVVLAVTLIVVALHEEKMQERLSMAADCGGVSSEMLDDTAHSLTKQTGDSLDDSRETLIAEVCPRMAR